MKHAAGFIHRIEVPLRRIVVAAARFAPYIRVMNAMRYIVLLFTVVVACATARPTSELASIKAAVMSADYRADFDALASLRTRAAKLSHDRDLGYLADYWSGFASWRIAMNGASAKMPSAEMQAHLERAVADFESAIHKKADFGDAYAAAAGVHGWLAAFKHADQTAMNEEIEIYKRQINRALALDPNNPRALWIQAVPYMVLPPERGGSVDRAIELYRRMVEISRPLSPESPLPDWGKVEGMMSLSFAHLNHPRPDLNAATEEAREALRLRPDFHYVKDVLVPMIEAKKK
jgi:hypothetical protein